jgi:chemotaxis protein CheD
MKAFAAEQTNEYEARRFTIGIAEQKITQAPDKLVTLGLGSCIGLVLYDPVVRIGGMVHIMLPSASDSLAVTNRFKFADTAIADMIKLMAAAGAARQRLLAKMAGGAHMFSIASTMNILNVGQRNIDMCRQVLSRGQIKIVSEDTGGTCGRSIEFCCESGALSVRTVAPQSIRVI